jgi:membrane-bound ClpP family serine protease
MFTPKTLLLLFILFLVAVPFQLTRAGTISGLPGGMKCADIFNNGNERCVFTIEIGEITPQTLDGIKKLLDYKRESNKQLLGSMVFLNSPGGKVHSAFQIGRLLRNEGLPVTIEKGARCVSACVFILAAARHRTIYGW